MRKITHIVFHTAASGDPTKGTQYDVSAATIDKWHRDKGWGGIGYNFVVRQSGLIEKGRDIAKIPAHVKGFNRNSIGVCFSGHGDVADFTYDQKVAGCRLIARLLVEHGLAETFRKNPMRVLGHREVNILRRFIGGIPEIHKTCPGTKVSCGEIRKKVLAQLDAIEGGRGK